jgi:hypothetical protein
MNSADAPSSAHSLIRSPLAWLAAFLILNLSVPFFNITTRTVAIVGALAVTFAYVAIVVFFAVAIAHRKLAIAHLLIWGVLTLVLWLVLDNVLGPMVAKPIIAAMRESHARPTGPVLLEIYALSTLGDMALLSFAVLVGNLAARLIQSSNMLGPVCAVIALVDVWGVLFGGIVSQMLAKVPAVAAKAMTSGPKIGAASGSRFAIPLPDIGVGDYLFIGLLFGALVWLGLNWRGAMKWVVPLVSVALLGIVFLPQIPALPGLLFIGLGVLIPNASTLKFTREEKFALLYAGVFVVILTGALYWGFKSVLPEKQSHAEAQSSQRK